MFMDQRVFRKEMSVSAFKTTVDDIVTLIVNWILFEEAREINANDVSSPILSLSIIETLK